MQSAISAQTNFDLSHAIYYQFAAVRLALLTFLNALPSIAIGKCWLDLARNNSEKNLVDRRTKMKSIELVLLVSLVLFVVVAINFSTVSNAHTPVMGAHAHYVQAPGTAKELLWHYAPAHWKGLPQIVTGKRSIGQSVKNA